MGGVIVETVAIALAVAISPMRTSVAILVLLSDRARLAGPLYLIGFVAGISFVTGLGLALGVRADLGERGNPPTAVSILILAVGLLLLGLASWTWHSRPKEQKEPVLPGWLRSIESLSPLLALGLGIGLSVVSFKNLGLILVATLLITQADLSPAAMVVLGIGFVVVASLGVGIPVGWFVLSGTRATDTLTIVKEWMTRHNNWVTAVSTGFGGLLLAGKGLAGLLG
jgi:hypothetical protein